MASELEDKFFDKFFHKSERQKEKSQARALLATLKTYHLPTYEHSLRVGLITSQIGEIIYLDSETGIWAALHDIGKLNVPLTTLDKNEGFNSEDAKIMRAHVTEGYEILRGQGRFFTAWIALTHHRYQGKDSYPSDEELARMPFPIPNACADTRLTAAETARITSLADTYDASHRRNTRFGNNPPTGEEIRKRMLDDNPNRKRLIEALYEKGVFVV